MPKKPKYNEIACPKCKQPISVAAEICPYCRTAFSVEEVAAHKRQHRWSMQVGCGVMAVIFLLVVTCSMQKGEQAPSSADATESPSPTAKPVPADVKAEATKFYKSLFAAMSPCDNAGKNTAQVAGNIQSGEASIYDGYRVATEQVGACKQSWEDIKGLDVPDALEGDVEEAADNAQSTCADAALSKQIGAQTMQEVFDGDTKPSKIEQMRQDVDTAQAGVLACAAKTVDMMAKAGVDIKDLPKID